MLTFDLQVMIKREGVIELELADLFDLKGKTAIVTGGGRGLGRQMAHALAEAGANIVICSRKLEQCEKTCEEIQELYNVKAIALACDIRNAEEIHQVVKKTIQQFGTLDILINNSGASWIGDALTLPEDKWQKVMDVNVKGTFLFSQAAATIMKQQGSGKIINITSVTGMYGAPAAFLDAIAYSTSKGAVISFTKDLAVKLAPFNIQVNALSPGLFPTKITAAMEHAKPGILRKIPAARFGDDKDLKGAALFLSSKASDYMTGQVMVLDGGLTASL